ncbi:MAG: ABC transporter permease [Desulfovibrio sp.]
MSALLHRFRLCGRLAAMAFQAVIAFPLRSLFVALGVACGVASLTLIVTSIDGANKKAVELVDMFGHDAVLMFGGNFKKKAVGARTWTLTWEDAKNLEESLPGAYLVVAMRAKRDIDLKRDGKQQSGVLVIGATENYASAWNWPLVEGQDFTAEQISRSERVCLLADQPAKELFGDESPIGHTILINNISFRVVGRLAYRGIVTGRHSIDNRVIIPLPTLVKRFNLSRKYFSALRVKFREPENMAHHVDNLKSYMRFLHNIKEGGDDDFSVLTADEVLKFFIMFTGGLTAFLGLTALCAMVVGGFVLANLFHLSVSERQSEIGLRKALGATSRAILFQFLLEAVILTIIGGAIGLGAGMLLGQLLDNLGIMEIVFSWKAFGWAFFSAVCIGVIFGLRPARRAASMSPIAALKGMDES